MDMKLVLACAGFVHLYEDEVELVKRFKEIFDRNALAEAMGIYVDGRSDDELFNEVVKVLKELAPGFVKKETA